MGEKGLYFATSPRIFYRRGGEEPRPAVLIRTFDALKRGLKDDLNPLEVGGGEGPPPPSYSSFFSFPFSRILLWACWQKLHTRQGIRHPQTHKTHSLPIAVGIKTDQRGAPVHVCRKRTPPAYSHPNFGGVFNSE